MVKRLLEKNKKPNNEVEIQNSKCQKGFYAPIAVDREEAIEKKLQRLRGNFFGKPIAKFEVGNIRNVWIPYCYVVYDFSVGGVKGVLKMAKKTGEVAVVFDMNEEHIFQYDIYESGHLELKKGSIDESKASIIKTKITDKDILKKIEEYIQYKVLIKSYASKGEIKFKMQKKFFRPAVEIEVIYKGRNSNLRYAYLDEYGVENEHVMGLKYRLNHR